MQASGKIVCDSGPTGGHQGNALECSRLTAQVEDKQLKPIIDPEEDRNWEEELRR